MKTSMRYVWAIYFVGFDDTADTDESRVEPYVGKERIAVSIDPRQAWQQVNLAVLSRGGQVLTLVADNEAEAESIRSANEAEILRRR